MFLFFLLSDSVLLLVAVLLVFALHILELKLTLLCLHPGVRADRYFASPKNRSCGLPGDS